MLAPMEDAADTIHRRISAVTGKNGKTGKKSAAAAAAATAAAGHERTREADEFLARAAARARSNDSSPLSPPCGWCGFCGSGLAAAAALVLACYLSFGPHGGHDDNAAIGACLMRAIESAHLPAVERLVVDDYAVHMLPASFARPGVWLLASLVARLGRKMEAKLNPSQQLWLGGCRVKMLDGFIESSIRKHGATQVVILGAGYDSRALRLPLGDKVRVFEHLSS